MIKVRPIQMDLNRSLDLNDPKNYHWDESWVKNLNYFFIPNQDFIWKDIQLTMDDDPDYWLVLGSIYDYGKNKYFDESKAILFHVEPYALRKRFANYNVNNFGSNFLKTYNILPLWWGTSLTYNQILEHPFTKTKELSAVLAASTGTEGHIKRLNFLRNYLSKLDMEHYGDERGQTGFFSNDPLYKKNYKGYVGDKGIGLRDYKYHYNCENTIEQDYLTEKIFEPIICETLCFYSGSPNVTSYLNEDSFIRLDLNDPEQAFWIVQNSIQSNEWERRRDILRYEKKKILNELNMLELTWLAIHGVKGYWEK
jgi:hypothetical protein